MHPDHQAVTDIVVNGAFYARLPKWDEVNGAPGAIEGTEPHDIDRLFFARCRMEPAWRSVDFSVDISDAYERKQAAIAAYTSVSRAIRRVWSNGTQQRTRRWQPPGRALCGTIPGAKSAPGQRSHGVREGAVRVILESFQRSESISLPGAHTSRHGGPKQWTGSSSSAFSSCGGRFRPGSSRGWVYPPERCRTHAGRRGRTTAWHATTAGRHRDRTDRQGVDSCDSFQKPKPGPFGPR